MSLPSPEGSIPLFQKVTMALDLEMLIFMPAALHSAVKHLSVLKNFKCQELGLISNLGYILKPDYEKHKQVAKCHIHTPSENKTHP